MTGKKKLTFAILLACALATCASGANASYSKFVKAKGTVRYPGIVTMYSDAKGGIWAEMPDSLIGRDFLLHSISRSEGNPTVPDGKLLSKLTILRMERHDTSVVFSVSSSYARPEDAEDEGMRNAIRNGMTRAVRYSFPVKYRNADSTASVFNIGKLFEDSLNDLNLKDFPTGDGYRIYKCKYNKALSGKPAIINRAESFGTVREAGFDHLNVASGMFVFETDGKANCHVQTTLTLLPRATATEFRIADERIGTRNLPRPVFNSDGRFVRTSRACRWDLSGDKSITVYIDTLLPAAYSRAAQEGVRAWNEAFVEAGLGCRIYTVPASAKVDLDSPLVSSIRYSKAGGSAISGYSFTNEEGQILAMHMTIPVGIAKAAMKQGMLSLCDVDSRFAGVGIDQSAVAEVLRAKVMAMTGRFLGLERNMTGSTAYSPVQLRNPSFTQSYGFSASVTDDATFNYLAQPGDKERGVVLIANRIGEYDKYAIAWLYGNGSIDEKREHRFVPAYEVAANPDPSGLNFDLGNDVIAAYEAGVGHLKYAAANADKWLEGDEINEIDKDLTLDYIWLQHHYYNWVLSKQIGGVSPNSLHQGSTLPKFTAVPEKVQRACLGKMLSFVEETSYLDLNRRLITFAGANVNTSDLTRQQLVRELSISTRLPAILAACELAGSTFTADEYLDAIEDKIIGWFKDGTVPPGSANNAADYIQALALTSRSMTADLKAALNPQSLTEFESASDEIVSINPLPPYYVDKAELKARVHIEKFAGKLRSARSRFGKDDAGKIDYLIFLADASLGKYRK